MSNGGSPLFIFGRRSGSPQNRLLITTQAIYKDDKWPFLPRLSEYLVVLIMKALQNLTHRYFAPITIVAGPNTSLLIVLMHWLHPVLINPVNNGLVKKYFGVKLSLIEISPLRW
jgi:hypothetical protein